MDNDSEREWSRRKLLERLAAGGALAAITLLPSRWIKPAIEAIVVPAYAGRVSGPSPSAPHPTASSAAPLS